jgi:hypothetical protein
VRERVILEPECVEQGLFGVGSKNIDLQKRKCVEFMLLSP